MFVLTHPLCFRRHASTCKPFEPVSGPHVWTRAQYEDVESYSYTLNESDITELAAAVDAVKKSGIELKVSCSVWHSGLTLYQFCFIELPHDVAMSFG